MLREGDLFLLNYRGFRNILGTVMLIDKGFLFKSFTYDRRLHDGGSMERERGYCYHINEKFGTVIIPNDWTRWYYSEILNDK